MTDSQALHAARKIVWASAGDVQEDARTMWKNAARATEEDYEKVAAIAKDCENHADELRGIAEKLTEMLSRMPDAPLPS
jgi:hypothetical protein